MRTFVRYITALLLAVVVNGLVATCGQKGPLRLPEQDAAAIERPAPRL